MFHRIECGKRFFILRKELGLTLQCFADMLGTSASYLSDIEKGKSKPSVDILSVIAKNYGSQLHWLLAGKVGEKKEFKVMEKKVNYEPAKETDLKIMQKQLQDIYEKKGKTLEVIQFLLSKFSPVK